MPGRGSTVRRWAWHLHHSHLHSLLQMATMKPWIHPTQYHNNTLNDEVCNLAWKWSWMSLIDTVMGNLCYFWQRYSVAPKRHAKIFFFFKGGNSGLYTLQFMVKRKKTVTQACGPTALKRTDERIKNCIILLDLSSPASSESVMFLSRTGAGGLETRLTEAIGERICLPSLPVQRVS